MTENAAFALSSLAAVLPQYMHTEITKIVDMLKAQMIDGLQEWARAAAGLCLLYLDNLT